MACRHPVSWRNGWILTKLAQLYCWDIQKNWLDFGDLDPIFKVTWGLRLLENGSSAPYLLKEWMDFDQTCTSILHWHGKELIRFFFTLTPFSRSHKGLDCWKMACLHLISWRNSWILTKLAQLYCCDMEKNCLYFGDLDPIFKVTGGLRLLENSLSVLYLLIEWMDFHQTHNYIVETRTRTESILVTLTPFSRSHIIYMTYFNNMSIQTGGRYTFSSENTVLVYSRWYFIYLFFLRKLGFMWIVF